MKAKEFKERLQGKIFSIEVQDDTSGESLGGYRDDDEWSRDSHSTDHSIRGFRVYPENHHGDLQAPFEPEKGVDYYLLYVVYTTGDSFGSDSGDGIEYIGLYTADQIDVAKENERRIETHNNSREDANLKLLQSGKEFDIYVPWKGYFEHLDYVQIDAVQRLN